MKFSRQVLLILSSVYEEETLRELSLNRVLIAGPGGIQLTASLISLSDIKSTPLRNRRDDFWTSVILWCCSGAIEHSSAGTKFSEIAFYYLSSSLAFLFSIETSVCGRDCSGIISGPWSIGVVVLLITERNTFVFLPLTDVAGLRNGAGDRCLGRLVYH